MERDLYRQIGRRIKDARENLGISQEELARQMGYTSPATISHFETGNRKVSVGDLQHISKILGIPLELFFESKDTTSTMQQFRLRAKKVRPAAREAVASFLAFAQKHGQRSPHIPSGTRDLRPGSAARKILEFAKVEEPPVSLSQVAKRINVPVFNWDFPDEVSGIFVIEQGAACVGVNKNHPNVRQRFTIAHELGHLIYHEGQDLFVDFTDMEVSDLSLDDRERELETKANQFAADLLMPVSWMRNDFNEYGEEGLTYLAQRYEVSEQAAWFRLLNLKLVKQQYERVIDEVSIG
jgi:Zn-dependent peptidase ImmA (M78 family)/DNA-binding XRE family transcriptional regulator